MRLFFKIVGMVFKSVALMCVGISFIVLCVFHSKPHVVLVTVGIGLGSAIVLAILGVVASQTARRFTPRVQRSR